MAALSRIHASKLLHLPTEIIQLIMDYLWPDETIELLIVVPKLADLTAAAKLRYQDRWINTILHRAVNKNAEATVKPIARRCAQDQVATCQGYTPLHLAISGGRIKITRMLVNADFDLSAKDLGGRTPLHWAWSESRRDSNFADIVQLMLAKGADPSVVAKFKENLLHVILEDNLKHNLTILQMVIDVGVGVNTLDSVGFSPLW
ncbi:isoform Er16 of ankyrin-1 [Aspergillus udagawae]|uniref:Isoform Er16 of ankyrin-1 n=1 Tax=Aspergillus udagawae TaxID=91492 RepID=A0A8H3SF85_9EURO|nr:isoform Er16 of ankyrin-1 [Aspergillus udagawae]